DDQRDPAAEARPAAGRGRLRRINIHVDTLDPGRLKKLMRFGTLEEIERAVAVISKQASPGLIVSPSPINTVNRRRLISIANENRIPAVFPFRFYVRDGALMAYGFNAADQFRRSAAYVARILQGEKPGDLPVQAPSLFELGVNLRTAKAMGLTMPQSLLVAADEIVE
ncbi:MAG: hypothetical protein HC869_20295, partial [Rhodospirillales bacterium]|nr:hypothetical protein [Rhodospirillales bacterium]